MIHFVIVLLLLNLVETQSVENATAHKGIVDPENASQQASASITSGTPSTTEKVKNCTAAASDPLLTSSNIDDALKPRSLRGGKKMTNRSATLNLPIYMRPRRANVPRGSQIFSVIACVVVAVIAGTIVLVFVILVVTAFVSAFKGPFKATSARLLKRLTRRLTRSGDDTTDLLQSMSRSASGPMERAGCSGEGQRRVVPYPRNVFVPFESIDVRARIV
ncbi:uncharacterized protein LOC135399622 [Ornithodoros turicata]|uniref:uncharacterized protein LOC135399622 n=1 Tax=Ornithodoros turicata TaxID=34597 RepID=UPI0031397DAC